MSGDPTLKSIDTKLDMFMTSQQRVNESFALAHKDITAALSKSDTQQVEINNLTTVVTKISSKQESQEDKINRIDKQQAVETTLVNQFDGIRKTFNRAIIGTFFMFLISIGSLVYNTAIKTQSNADVATLIAEMIKKDK